MENASKALIIAGAILLAIVIISLGLIVVNNVRNTVDTSNLSEQEIQAFNAKFVAYEGTSVSGSRVNSLIQQVIATNQEIAKSGSNNFIAIAFPSISGNSGNPYVFVGSKTGGVEVSGIKPYLPNDEDADDTVKRVANGCSIVAVRNYFRETDGTGTSSLSVETGKNYTVKLTYHNGMVAGITVKANS